MPASGKTNGRFQLPKLTPVNFSLTDGTDIPPPLPESPIEEQHPAPTATPAQQTNTSTSTNGGGGYAQGQAQAHRGQTASTDAPPLSPASTTRPSSIRRFLSRKSLNANYTNGTNHNDSQDDLTSMRPDSPASFMTNGTGAGRPGLKGKKSGSWFRRLGNSGGNRTSVVYEAPRAEENKKMGPPPPKLPELNQLKAKVQDNDPGSLGADDMFKNIK
ncbi:hypothetical protein LSUE1_G010247 [Lachnellula suecica]|uniref:Uncharacterized protein n=1 Tax=Lachnellula suecica TaxID=602035 RepID=A0A8T9BSM2_9HELO|nr:hypothetical protein LSUE1_G010247 [Lachnellula suecica]